MAIPLGFRSDGYHAWSHPAAAGVEQDWRLTEEERFGGYSEPSGQAHRRVANTTARATEEVAIEAARYWITRTFSL